MKKTTRLKKPQIPELDHLYDFDDLGGRPKYGGVEMTSETNIPSFDEIRDETHSMVVAEATARDDADEELQAQITAQGGDIAAETSARQAADTALQTALEAETTARTTADTNLAQSVSDEATARAAADAAEVTARNNAIATETTARQTADTGLQTQIDAIVASSDVKDIVGTYADLQAYDTSTLGDRDIIKVLQDETHQDETTYYRWGATAQTFTLIGEEGPYYTKAATDTLLNDKADKATTYTKTETDTLLGAKADQVTTYTKTETDTLLGGKQNTLTAGANITIANDVISAQAGVKEILTTDSDFNSNLRVFMSTHDAGVYKITNPTNSNVEIYSERESADEYQWTFYIRGNSSVIYIYGKATQGMSRCAVFGAYSSSGAMQDFIACPGAQYEMTLLDKRNINSLDGGSSRGDTVLDARQGKVLKDLIDSLAISGAGAPTTSTVGTVGKIYEDTTNGKLYICTAVDDTTDPQNPSYTWEEVGSSINVVQTVGASTTDVMSQDATTEMVYRSRDIGGGRTSRCKVQITNLDNDASYNTVAIGYNANCNNDGSSISIGRNAMSNQGSISIGDSAKSWGLQGSIAIGVDAGSNWILNNQCGQGAVLLGSYSKLGMDNATGKGQYAVGIGSFSYPRVKGQVDISTTATTNTYGYNDSQYRLLSGLYDPQTDHDAATKGYVDSNLPSAYTTNEWNALWAQRGNKR